MIEQLFEIFQYDFMQRALVAGVVIGCIAPLIGMYLVTRGYSLMADTLSHVALAGVAIGVLLGAQPLPVALIATVLASMAIDKLTNTRMIFGESALAIFLSASLAFAVVMMGLAGAVNVDLLTFLFGSITTVTQADVWYILIFGGFVMVMIGVLYQRLLLVSFDEEIASAAGVQTRLYNQLIVILAAIAVALSMRIVGVLLIGALMVIPVISGILLGKSFVRSHLIALGISLFSVISGIFLSYGLGTATGGTIVLVSVVLFLLSLFFGGKR
jgi:zinc transport system permease protein